MLQQSTPYNPFPSYYEEFIFTSRYAKWREELGRRETWHETVTRLVDYYENAVHLPQEICRRSVRCNLQP